MESKKKKFNWQTLVIISLVITLTSLTIFIINNEKEKIANQEPEKVYVGLEKGEPLENFSREGAVVALQQTLKSLEKDVEGKNRSVQERLQELNSEETDMEDVISKETLDKLYLAKEFKGDKFNRQFTASALFTYHEVIKEVTQSDELKPMLDSSTFDDLIYFDEKLMVAHVPADVFLGENRGMAFEMQYIDGEWKLNPYTAMMSLIMLLNYEGQMNQLQNQNSEE